MARKTIKEYQEENAYYKQKIDDLLKLDETQRKEFATVFRWYDKNGLSYVERSVKTPSWAEIFCEIGRLLSADKILTIQSEVENLRRNQEGIKHYLFKDEKDPNTHE